jgi:hypothetical protein
MSHTLRLLATLAVALASAWTVTASPVAAATTPNCLATQLSIRIVDWQGAAGSRIADVFLVNTSFVTCVVRNYPRVQLVDRHGIVLINGSAASTTAGLHTLQPLGILRSEVSASNYCGGTATAPVTLAFRLQGSLGRVVAMPRSSADTSGVPPCLGAPGSAGHIAMHAWHT